MAESQHENCVNLSLNPILGSLNLILYMNWLNTDSGKVTSALDGLFSVL